MTVYAHNDVNLVEVDDRIEAGGDDRAGRPDRTGHDAHVHFEIRREGLAYNPLYLLPLPPRVGQIDEGRPKTDE